MLAWFRAAARPISSAALASILTLTVWSATPHPDDCHETECLSAPHDPTGHSLGRKQDGGEQPFHCVFCHWTRSVRPPSPATYQLAPSVDDGARHLVVVSLVLPQFSAAQPPLRAPPSSSVA
jgi:hypothetical protein